VDRFEGRFGVVKNDSSKAKPKSKSEGKMGFIHIDSRKETRGKVTQDEGWRTTVANPAQEPRAP
jgi:hypothetical protein